MHEPSFDFDLINNRIDIVLAENKQIQKIAVIMMFALFLMGVGLLVFSFFVGNKVIAGFGGRRCNNRGYDILAVK
jgi:hypothetical protein